MDNEDIKAIENQNTLNADLPTVEYQRSPEADVVEFEQVDDKEGTHRYIAGNMHLRRAVGQYVTILLYLMATLAALFYWRTLAIAVGYHFGNIWPPSSTTLGVANLLLPKGALVHSVPLIFFVMAPGTVLLVFYAIALFYRHNRNRDWAVDTAAAASNEPRKAASGYMGVFRLYARTKRRAIFLFMASAVATAWTTIGMLVWVFASGDPTSAALGILYFIPLVTTAFGAFALGHIGFDISRKYVPGKVLVLETMILAYRAATSQTNYSDARASAEEFQAEMMDEKPWWFYSYWRAPK